MNKKIVIKEGKNYAQLIKTLQQYKKQDLKNKKNSQQKKSDEKWKKSFDKEYSISSSSFVKNEKKISLSIQKK